MSQLSSVSFLKFCRFSLILYQYLHSNYGKVVIFDRSESWSKNEHCNADGWNWDYYC